MKLRVYYCFIQSVTIATADDTSGATMSRTVVHVFLFEIGVAICLEEC